jgi:pimeloyl-ACP methyl ester carboxylesterase
MMAPEPPELSPEFGALVHQSVELAPGLVHHEWYTMQGLLTVLWHGDPGASTVVVACGGAMGGLLGPDSGLYQRMGERLAEDGRAMARVSYRRPNDLPASVEDLMEVAGLAVRRGAERIVTVGHSFGGAVAIQVGTAMAGACVGVVTFATQSAGCEHAGGLGAPLLLLHGDRDRILPPMCSEVVHDLVGEGSELVILPEVDHLMAELNGQLDNRILHWVTDRLAG